VLQDCDLVADITPVAKPMARLMRRWTLGSEKRGWYAICVPVHILLYIIVLQIAMNNGGFLAKRKAQELLWAFQETLNITKE
jgi:hypothetical protein